LPGRWGLDGRGVCRRIASCATSTPLTPPVFISPRDSESEGVGGQGVERSGDGRGRPWAMGGLGEGEPGRPWAMGDVGRWATLGDGRPWARATSGDFGRGRPGRGRWAKAMGDLGGLLLSYFVGRRSWSCWRKGSRRGELGEGP